MNRMAPTGSSATTEVLIERTRVWLTARLAASPKVRLVAGDPVGVLAHLVEDHHGVVERVAQDGQEADHRRRRDLEADQGVDADGEHQVVHQGDQAATAIVQVAEVQRDHGGDQGEEDEQPEQRLLG